MKSSKLLAIVLMLCVATVVNAQTLTRTLVLKPAGSAFTTTLALTAAPTTNWSLLLPATGNLAASGPFMKVNTGVGDKTVSFGQVNLGSNLAAGDITGTLKVSNGGTGVTSVPLGDLLIGSGTDVMNVLAAGADGKVLTMVSGTPQWSDVNSLVTSLTRQYTVTATDATNGFATITPSAALPPIVGYAITSKVIITYQTVSGPAQAFTVSNQTATTFDVYSGAMVAGDKINYIIVN